ncbi:hypothetical protein D9M70_396530 [compost metagenome]
MDAPNRRLDEAVPLVKMLVVRLRGMTEARFARAKHSQLARVDVGKNARYLDVPVRALLCIEYLDASCVRVRV